jgi:hypothetical protein
MGGWQLEKAGRFETLEDLLYVLVHRGGVSRYLIALALYTICKAAKVPLDTKVERSLPREFLDD